jgi:hypothetical protein
MNGLTWSIGGMILTEKPKYWEKNLSQFHFVHHKSRMDGLGSNPGLRGCRPTIGAIKDFFVPGCDAM